jgi:nucleoid DNA-binding protein
MTKAELIERVYGGKYLPRDLTKKTVARIVNAVFTEMGDYFIRTRVSRNQGARLTYPGFGTFSKRRRPPRMVKNPQTGAPITIPQQETIIFSPGQELRSLLNRNGKSANGKSGPEKSHEKSADKSGDKPAANRAPAPAKPASAAR